jgi:hypothetical protein
LKSNPEGGKLARAHAVSPQVESGNIYLPHPAIALGRGFHRGSGGLPQREQYWDLREGIGLLIPPHVKHRLVNTSDEPLQMIMLTWASPPPLT